jgi:hypothetical protein
MTSIEWLIDQLEKKGDMRETSSIRNLQLNIDTSDYLELKRQAKLLHKQEIIDAWKDGAYGGGQFTTTHETSEQYYQETFGSKGSDDHISDVSKMVDVPQQETLYTEEQVREVAKYTISEWVSMNEKREHDHEKLVKTWLSIELQNFIQSLKQPKK